MIAEIDGIEIDLGDSILAVSKQAYDFSDLSLRFFGRTNQVVLPFTQKNIKRFKDPNVINAESKAFEKVYSLKVKDSGQFIFNGIAFLNESNSSFKMQGIENVKIFFDSLNNNISDLDFESSDFTYGTTAYNTLKIPNSTVWIWAVACQHENKIAANTLLAGGAATDKLKYSRPFFSMKVIAEKIFSTQNWNLNLLDDFDKYERSMLSSNHEQFFVTDYQKTIDQTNVLVAATPQFLTDLTVNDFEETTIVTASNSINIKQHNAAFRLRGNISTTTDFTITFQGTSNPVGSDVQFQSFQVSATDTFIDITTNVFKTSEANNVIQIELLSTPGGSVIFDDTLLYTIIEEETLGNFSSNLLLGFLVKAHDNIPEISQLDFLKSIFNMYAAAFNSDGFQKRIDLFSYKRLNKLNSIDWSSKFISKSHTLSGSIGSYGQINYLKYDNDDIAGSRTGQSQFLSENDTFQNEYDALTIEYGASPEVVIDSGGTDYTMIDMPVYDDTVRINDLNVRVCTYVYDGTLAFTIAQFNELDWNILSNDYSKIFNSLNRVRVLKASFDLNKLDFTSFNHQKVVYIEHFKSYFIVMPIDNFISGKETKCTLLKLN